MPDHDLKNHDLQTARECFSHLVSRLHPINMQGSGARVHYAALACSAFLNRCIAACKGTAAPLIRLFSRLLMTRFRPVRVSKHPPSWFELAAANVMRRRNMPGATGFQVRWEQIQRSASAPEQVGAERRAWRTVRDRALLLNWIYFGTLCPSMEYGGGTGMTFRIVG